MTPPELRDLLADSLVLWDMAGRARVTEGAVRVTADAADLAVRAADAGDLPVRWWIEREGQRKPCTSVLGLLRGVRNALGGGTVARLRVAAPDEA